MSNIFAVNNMQKNDKHSTNLSFNHVHSSQHYSVKILLSYRLIIASFLFSQILFVEHSVLNIVNADLYSWMSFIFLISALFWILTSWNNPFYDEQRIAIQIYADIFITVFIIHACGGVESGLGILLVINIIMTSLLCTQAHTLIFTALATIGLLAEHLYVSLTPQGATSSSTQVGLVGIALFATSYVASRFSSEVKKTNDIAKQQQSDLANLSALNNYIIETMQSGIIALDQHYNVKHINQAANTLLQSKLLLDRPLYDSHAALFRLFEHWTHHFDHQDRLYLPEESHIENVQVRFKQIAYEKHHGYLIFVSDLSLIQKQANQQKLAALGHLTANIAHEIRNPLGALSHASQLLAESKNLDKTDTRMTEIIQQHSDRINHIIEDVLKLSRSKQSERECLEIEDWLNQFIKEYCLGSEATIECFAPQFNTHNSRILFDPGHLSQILTNLCDNAKSHGSNSKPIHFITSIKDQKFFIEIADEGKGIDKKDRSKVTEPFYTTSTKGSGLGLYIVNQLCDINSAQLLIESNQYKGTSVKIISNLIDE